MCSFTNALERAGIRGLSEGQTISLDTKADECSGEIAVSSIQLG